MDIKKLVAQMTLEEKAAFCSGADEWHIEGLDRLAIPKTMMTDGPHGLRKKVKTQADSYYYGDTVRSTCFPSAAGLASTWNKELLYELGGALAAEAKGEQVSIVLGPGINMKRSPVCGRNFEYFSEDPYLAGKLSSQYIQGVQAKGVGTSLKHFAANNQEHRRHSTNAIIDDRTLREIYLTAFEIAVKEAKPTTIMHSYNCINGQQVSKSKWLLTDILRNEWGYDGMVMSDWNGMNDRVTSLIAGTDLEMPGSFGIRDAQIVKAVREGILDERVVDTAVERILKTVYDCLPDENAEKADLVNSHAFCTRVGEEAMVLLKNEGGLLPLADKKPIAVIGAFAKTPRYQGSGSSRVVPAFVDDIVACIKERNEADVTYAEGYCLDGDVNAPDEELLEQAVQTAKAAGRAIIFAGMPDVFEAEGYDRSNMNLPQSHNALIERIAKEVPETVVVLLGGSPVEMPWLKSVSGLFYAYLGGCAVGKAITRLLYGDVNPSGKLAETFPEKYEHNPSYLNFPGVGDDVIYAEGVFIGYRYYQKKNIPVNFSFGYGLSYTTFSYDEIKVDGDTVTVKVTNTGNVGGKEVVELYVGAEQSFVARPVKELKGFQKIYLEAGQSKTVKFELDDRSFAYYDVRVNDWRVETGKYIIYVGGSSDNTPLTAVVEKVDKNPYIPPITINTPVVDIITMDVYKPIRQELLTKIIAGNPEMKAQTEQYGYDLDSPVFKRRKYHTLRMTVRWNQGTLTEDMIYQYIAEANAKLFGK